MSEQFQDDSFAALSGARVVRIATHPNAQGRGYGSRALELLIKYFSNQLIDFDNIKTDELQEFKAKKKETTPAEKEWKNQTKEEP